MLLFLATIRDNSSSHSTSPIKTMAFSISDWHVLIFFCTFHSTCLFCDVFSASSIEICWQWK